VIVIIYALFGIGVAAAGWRKYGGNHSLLENIFAFIGFALLWPAVMGYAAAIELFD